MYWVIQENLYSEDGFERLLRALEVLDLPHSVHKIVPFVHDLVPDVAPQGPVMVMGAYTMIHIAQRRGWIPGAYSDARLDYEHQLRFWGERMLNADAWFGPLSAVPRQRQPFFIRPVVDSKFFAGHVMAWGGFTEWLDAIQALGWEGTVTPDTQVMVSSKKEIWREYRTWVVGGKVVTSSLYKMGRRPLTSPDVPPEVLAFAEDCVQLWTDAPRAYCLDIAETPDGLKVVEVNCLNAAGFYAGDVGALVQALEDLEK